MTAALRIWTDRFVLGTLALAAAMAVGELPAILMAAVQ